MIISYMVGNFQVTQNFQSSCCNDLDSYVITDARKRKGCDKVATRQEVRLFKEVLVKGR